MQTDICRALLCTCFYVIMYYFVVRLAGGPTECEGRVKVYHNSRWYSVCDITWNLNDAQVVCRELGYGMAISAGRTQFYGRYRGRGVWFDDLKCVGTEWTIRNCLHKRWSIRKCFYDQVAGVTCSAG